MKRYVGLVIPAAVLLLDRLSKWLVMSQPAFFKPLLNTDMAFSLPLWPWVYYPAVALALTGLIWAGVKAWRKQHVLEWVCVTTIITAALSNMLDRVYYGGVVDFIATPNGGVFNLADVAIVLAVVVWGIHMWKYDKTISTHN